MKNQSEMIQLKKLVTRLGMNTPVPAHVRDHIAASKKRNLETILKKQGRYGILVKLVLAFMYCMKKYGINLTFPQSCIVLSTSALLTVSGMTTGSYVLVRHYIEKTTDHVRQEELSGAAIKEPSAPLQKKNEEAISIPHGRSHNRIFMEKIETISADTALAQKATSALSKYLTTINGRESIIHSSADKSVRYALTGSISRFDNAHIISVKVIDRLKSTIVYANSQKVAKKEDIPDICRTMAQDIAEAIR